MDTKKVYSQNFSDVLVSRTKIQAPDLWLEKVAKLLDEHTRPGVTEKELLSDYNFLMLIICGEDYKAPSISKYDNVKDYLTRLLKYYDIDEAVIPPWKDTLSAFSISTSFKNIQEPFNLIDSCGRMLVYNYRPDEDLVKIKSIVALCWYGITAEKMVNIKKTDLEPSDCSLLIGDEHVTFPKEIFDVLFAQSQARGYVKLAKTPQRTQRKNYTESSEFLLRDNTDKGGSLQKPALWIYLSRFNKVLSLVTNKRFDFDELQKNGLYAKVYEDSSSLTLIDKIKKHKKCDRRMAFNYKAQYETWLENINR